MEIQENDIRQIPDNLVGMVSYEDFCRVKEGMKREMALFDEQIRKVRVSGYNYADRFRYMREHNTSEKVMESYYLRIKDLDKASFGTREYVNTPVCRVVSEEEPDDLKFSGGYAYRKEIEAIADKDGVIYLFNKCVGRVRKVHWLKERFDIVIKAGTDAIADSALADNYLITSVELPDSVTVIGTGAFERSGLLARIGLSRNLKYIKDAAFRFCWELQDIDLPEGLVYIGADAFRKCKSLTELNIPDSVTYIGSKAFFGCVSLKSVRLPAHITNIGSGAFRHCHQLAEIVIPEEVTVIEKYAFANCSYLEKISLPGGLKRIEDGAFADCRKLKVIEIPDSVEYIGEDIFGKRKKYSTIAASADNDYVRKYAAENHINFTDHFTDEMYREILKKVSTDGENL